MHSPDGRRRVATRISAGADSVAVVVLANPACDDGQLRSTYPDGFNLCGSVLHIASGYSKSTKEVLAEMMVVLDIKTIAPPIPFMTQSTTTLKKNIAELKKETKMYKTENDIAKDNRKELNALMNQRLASAIDLQLQMKQAHWNVKGPSFIGLHELFDKVNEAVESYVDMIAERIVQLGGIAEGLLKERCVFPQRAPS